MYQASSDELIQELNRALEALRITDPTLSRSKALLDSVVIEEFWEELYEQDPDRAVSWVKCPDTEHLREDLYYGESLPFTYDNIGQAFEAAKAMGGTDYDDWGFDRTSPGDDEEEDERE